jgi:hypothetical protein
MKAVVAISLLALGLGVSGSAQAAPAYDSTLGFGGSDIDQGCAFGSLVGDRFPRIFYDPKTNERVMANLSACTGGYVTGTNEATGAHWNVDIYDNGKMEGRDADGHPWRFDPKARLFTNLATSATCARTSLRHVCTAQPN